MQQQQQQPRHVCALRSRLLCTLVFTQFATNLLDVNKATDTINVHYYSHSVHRWNFTTDTQLLELIHDIATAANKSLYVPHKCWIE